MAKSGRVIVKYEYEKKVSAYKFCRVDKIIKNIASELNLRCEISRCTTYLKEYVRFKVEGKKRSEVVLCKKAFEEAMREHNIKLGDANVR